MIVCEAATKVLDTILIKNGKKRAFSALSVSYNCWYRIISSAYHRWPELWHYIYCFVQSGESFTVKGNTHTLTKADINVYHHKIPGKKMRNRFRERFQKYPFLAKICPIFPILDTLRNLLEKRPHHLKLLKSLLISNRYIQNAFSFALRSSMDCCMPLLNSVCNFQSMKSPVELNYYYYYYYYCY